MAPRILWYLYTSVADSDPGSGAFFDPWIGDHNFESFETIFWVKYIKFFDEDPDPNQITNDKIATVQGSILASCDTVESEVRHMKQCCLLNKVHFKNLKNLAVDFFTERHAKIYVMLSSRRTSCQLEPMHVCYALSFFCRYIVHLFQKFRL